MRTVEGDFSVVLRATMMRLLALAALALGASASIAAESWTGSGQPGQGGLISSTVINDVTGATQIHYTSVYGSGIYRSTDAGLTWTAQNAGLGLNLRTRSLATPSQASVSIPILYVAVDGDGVYRTSGASVNWTAMNSGLNCRFMRALTIASGATSTLYAGTQCDTSSGVYKSTDSGSTWSQVNTGGNGMPSSLPVLTLTSDSTGQILNAGTDGQGIYRSTNGGTTWSAINGSGGNILPANSAVFSIRVVGTSPTWLLASVEGQGIYKSSDSGVNWFAASNGLPSTTLTGIISQPSSTTNNVYVSVQGYGLYRATSTDSFGAWTAFANANHTNLPFARFIFGDTTGKLFAGTFAGPYDSTDGGLTWTPRRNGLPGGFTTSSSGDPGNSNYVYAAGDVVYKSTDAGTSWVRSDSGVLGIPFSVVVDPSPTTTLYVSTTDKGIFRSTDSGANWFAANFGLPANLAGQNARLWRDNTTPINLYASFEGAGVWRASGGIFWTDISSNLPAAAKDVRSIRVDPNNASNLFASTAVGLYRSTNGGTSWALAFQQLAPGSIPQSVNNVTFNRLNSNEVYLGTFNADALGNAYSFSGVWKSSNGGTSWTQVLAGRLISRVSFVGGAPDLPIVYAGTYADSTYAGGVLRSLDGGATWPAFNTGLSNLTIRSFERNALFTSVLRVSTAGGIFNLTGGVDAALDAVIGLLTTFMNTVNGNSANLADSHLTGFVNASYPTGFFDANFRSGGENASTTSKEFADFLRGKTISTLTITGVNSYDDVNGVISLRGIATIGGVTELFGSNDDDGAFIFKRQTDGSYRFYGDQQIARTQARIEMSTDDSPGFSAGPRQKVNFNVSAPPGTVTGASVSGTGLGAPIALSAGTNQIESIEGAPGVFTTITRNNFYYNFDPSPVLGAGAVYTFTLTKSDTTQVIYTVAVQGTPVTDTVNGKITVTSPTGHTLASANLGSPLNIQWTLPTAYSALSVQLSGNVNTTSGANCSGDDLNFPGSATSGTITLSATCNSETIVSANFYISTQGANGERSSYNYGFSGASGTPPATPTGFTFGGNSQTQMKWFWDSSAGATSYGVYRATSSGGPFVQIATPTQTNYIDSGLAANTPYYYKVSAINSAGESAQSAFLSAATLACVAADCTTPSVPSTVTAVADSSTQVTISWTASSDSGGSGLASYRLFRFLQSNSISTFSLATLGTGTLSYVDTTAAPNTAYNYFIQACDGAGNCSVNTGGGAVTTPAAAGAVRIIGTNAVRRGGGRPFTAWYQAQGHAASPYVQVSPSWSYPSAYGSVDGTGFLSAQTSLPADEVNNLQATFSSITGSKPVKLQQSSDHWSDVPPAPGGDVRSLFSINSGTMLIAGIYGGGVFRSTDGTSWTPTFGLPDRLRAMRFIRDFSDRILLAGTEGDGIYRSVDGGQNWTPSNTGFDCGVVRNFAGYGTSSGASPNNVFAGTDRCGVYQSTNAGQSWSRITALPVTQPVSALISSTGPNILWVGTYGEGVYLSTDNGVTWQQRNSGLPSGSGSVILSLTWLGNSPNDLIATVEGQGVFKLPGGTASTTWVNITSNLPSTRVNPGIADLQSGFLAASAKGVYVTVDGYGVYRTTNVSPNVGNSWTQVVSFASEPRLKRTFSTLTNDSAGVMYIGTGSGVYKSSDQGATWAPAMLGLPRGRVFSTITDSSNLNNILAVSDRVYKSTNAGATWFASDSGIDVTTGQTSSVVTGGVILGSPAAYYVTTVNAGVFKSTDGGANWSAVNNGLPALVGQGVVIRQHTTDPNTLYAGYPNTPLGAYRSVDGGANWTSITGNLSGNALYVRPVVNDPATGALLAGTRAGLYRSLNNGTTWTQIFPIASGLVTQVRVDSIATPPQVYWIVSDRNALDQPTAASGFYRMNADGTGSVTSLLTGRYVFNARGVRSTTSPGIPPVLYVATWEESASPRGVLRSLDGGATWSELNAGTFGGSRVSSFEIASDGTRMLRASSLEGGVYQYMAPGNVNLTITHQGPNTGITSIAPLGYLYSCSNPTSNPVTCVFSIPSGTSLTLSANVPAGSTPGIFSGGTGSAAGCATSTCSFTLTADSSVTTTFNQNLGPFPVLTIALAGTGTGDVYANSTCQNSNPSGNSACSTAWASGSVVTLQATPAAGSAFGGFSGACVSNTTTCTFTITTNSSVTATFNTSGADTQAPTVPTGLAAAAVGSSQISLAWSASTDNVGVTLYKVYGGAFPGGVFRATVNSPALTYSDTGLAASTLYSYSVAACDAAGNCSAQSASAGATTPAAGGGPTLWIRGNNGPNSSLSVRAGQTSSYQAVLVRADGTIVDPVSATWIITAGPASVNSSGVVTGNAVAVNTAATLEAQFSDFVLTGGATLTTTFPLTVQASQDQWTGGRNPAQGGDVRGFTVLGTTLLAPVYGGGIYRSTDGMNWQQSGYGIPFRSSARVRTVRTVPNTTTQALAAIEGQGIYRSSDSGVTWTASNTGMSCNYPFSLASRTANGMMYAAATCGVFRSSDGGNAWSYANLAGTGLRGVQAFISSDTVWAWTTGSGLYRTSDGGLTAWQQMNNGLPANPTIYSFDAVASNLYLTWVEGAGVYRSSDGGATWAPENSGLPAGAQGQGLQGSIGRPGDGYSYVSIEGFGLYRGTAGASGTGAMSWSAWGNTATQLPKRTFTPGLVSGVYYVTGGQGVFRSTDSGVTWSAAKNGLPGGFVVNTQTDSSNTNIAYAAADTVYKTTDGGANWVQADTGITGAVSFGFRGFSGVIIRASNSELYVSTANAGIFKSTNSAASWFPVNNGLPRLLGTGVSPRPHPTDSQTMYAMYGDDPLGVYMTSNGGASWSSISSNLTGNGLYVNAIAADPASGALYLGTQGGLYKTAGPGSPWTLMWSAGPSGGNTAGPEVNHVRIDSGTSPSTVYWSTNYADASNTALASSGIYRSTDGGASYTQILSSRLVFNFRVLRSGSVMTLYAASWNIDAATGGVLRSTDGGITWQTLNAGNFHNYVNSFDPVNNQMVRMSTRGNGAFSFANASPPPVAPTGVTATVPAGTSNVQISWSTVAGATSYNIYMATASGVKQSNYNLPPYSTLYSGHTHANVTSPYTHAAAAIGTHYMVVTALNANGESVESAEASATVAFYNLNVSSIYGTVTSNIGAINCGATCTAQYAAGASVTFTAAPAVGYVFGSWTGCDSPSGATCTMTMNGTKSVTANYTLQQSFLLTVNVTGSGSVSSNPAGISCPGDCTEGYAGTVVTLTPNPASGYTWSGDCTGTGACSVTMSVARTVGITFSGATLPMALEAGFNLVGNSYTTALNVAATFGNQDQGNPIAGVTDKVDAVWRWNAATQKWQFFTPQLTAAASAAYATSHNYEVLSSVPAGEGYWISTYGVFTLNVPTGTGFNYGLISFGTRPQFWNLLSIGSILTVQQFNCNVGSPPSPGQACAANFESLWAWKATSPTKWYFYSPQLDGGVPFTNCTYAGNNGYLCFDTTGKTLAPGVGFWVYRP